PAQQKLPQPQHPTGKPFHIPAPVVWTVVALLVIAITPVTKRIRRTRRHRGSPAEIVVGAFTEFLDRARDLGWATTPAETHREFASRVGQGNGTEMRELASVTTRVLYAEPAPTTQDATE